MAYRHVNRKNLVYYLGEQKDANGNIEYFFSKQARNGPDTIPEGYKVVEDEGGKVFLKKIPS